MRILALDLGTKSCGFAISDPNNIIASGLENFRFELNHFNLVIEKVLHYLNKSEYQGSIGTIVLGYPLRMNLSKSQRTYMVERFGERLKKVVDIPVVFQDERQSTIGAQEILQSAGWNTKKSKSKKDSLAAQLILEDYLKGIKYE